MTKAKIKKYLESENKRKERDKYPYDIEIPWKVRLENFKRRMNK